MHGVHAGIFQENWVPTSAIDTMASYATKFPAAKTSCNISGFMSSTKHASNDIRRLKV